MTKHVRLSQYDASDLDRLSYSSGDIVFDVTNTTARLMDGVTLGGFKLATTDYVQNNAITSANLASNLATALVDYAKKTDLAPYALTVDVNSAIAAIPIYSLPTATTSVLGGVKVDGTSITINNGVISGSNQYTLPIATTGVIGGVRPDGTTITINPATGVISGANTYTLPTASTTIKGGVKVDGTTITINGSGVISGANTYSLPAATTSVLGGVIIPAVGTSGITNTSGTIGLAVAGTSQLGGVTIPAVANSGLTNTAGAIRLATATTNQLGGVKVDGVTITINGSGVIAANITGAIVFQGGWSAATNTPTLNNSSSSYNTNGFEFVCTASGTVNFGAGNVTFAVGDNVIYDGTKWVKIPIGSSAGTTNNILTFDNTGTGSASGAAFNGSAILTVSYNTIGASPLAGSSSITTVGTIATGTWNADIIPPGYGGTGVNNGSRTLTISGASRTIDQNITAGSSPNFDGANFSGTATNLIAGNATVAATATTAGKATNIAGGANFRIPYNTALDTTAFIAAPADGTYLKYTTAGGIAWGSVTTATNLAGGAANQIHVQTGVGSSGFIVAPTVTGTYLQWNGTAFVFAAVSGATGGTVTSVGGTGTVSGITLTGTVTGAGNLTLGGTLSLVSPGAIGSTTASTGRFTTLTTTATGVTTAAGGQFYLNGATNNRIDYNTAGVAAPTFNGISAGAKIVLYPNNGAAAADYAIGIESSTMWFGTPTTGEQFKWYGGTTVAMTLSSAGAVTATSFAGSLTGAVAATTLSASSTVSGTGFSTYLASPPAIGGTTPAAGTFTQVLATSTGGIGFASAVGAGGAITQTGSRTATVTINKPTGQITLFAAAGSTAAWTTFTVSNTTVTAADTVVVNAATGTNTYLAIVSAVAANSFNISFISISGTASDSPVFNFTVINGSNN